MHCVCAYVWECNRSEGCAGESLTTSILARPRRWIDSASLHNSLGGCGQTLQVMLNASVRIEREASKPSMPWTPSQTITSGMDRNIP